LSDSIYCDHVYNRLGPGPCPKCGHPTHDINWEEFNEQNRRWKIENPNGSYGGWWSI